MLATGRAPSSVCKKYIRYWKTFEVNRNPGLLRYLYCCKRSTRSSHIKADLGMKDLALQEMGNTGNLFAVSAVMFVGAYIAGVLPAVMNLKGSRSVSLVNAAGAGLLVGAALCIVLPEGFVTFFEAQESLPDESRRPEWVLGASLLMGFMAMMGLQALSAAASAAAGGVVGRQADSARKPKKSLDDMDVERPGTAALGRGSGSGSGSTYPGRVSEEAGSLVPRGGSAGALDAEGAAHSHAHTKALSVQGPGRRTSSGAEQALYGLLVHAAADGLAVGVASLSTSVALSLSVAAAIMVHKFPVAFGLTSFLRGAGWSGARLQKALLAFSAAAPLAALITFAILGRFPAFQDEQNVALAILFSGGTVLYAGFVHVLPSVLQGDAHPGHGPVPPGGGYERVPTSARDEPGEGQAAAAAAGAPVGCAPSLEPPHAGRLEMAALAAGALVPLLVAAMVPEM